MEPRDPERSAGDHGRGSGPKSNFSIGDDRAHGRGFDDLQCDGGSWGHYYELKHDGTEASWDDGFMINVRTFSTVLKRSTFEDAELIEVAEFDQSDVRGLVRLLQSAQRSPSQEHTRIIIALMFGDEVLDNIIRAKGSCGKRVSVERGVNILKSTWYAWAQAKTPLSFAKGDAGYAISSVITEGKGQTSTLLVSAPGLRAGAGESMGDLKDDALVSGRELAVGDVNGPGSAVTLPPDVVGSSNGERPGDPVSHAPGQGDGGNPPNTSDDKPGLEAAARDTNEERAGPPIQDANRNLDTHTECDGENATAASGDAPHPTVHQIFADPGLFAIVEQREMNQGSAQLTNTHEVIQVAVQVPKPVDAVQSTKPVNNAASSCPAMYSTHPHAESAGLEIVAGNSVEALESHRTTLLLATVRNEIVGKAQTGFDLGIGGSTHYISVPIASIRVPIASGTDRGAAGNGPTKRVPVPRRIKEIMDVIDDRQKTARDKIADIGTITENARIYQNRGCCMFLGRTQQSTTTFIAELRDRTVSAPKRAEGESVVRRLSSR